MFGFEGDVFLVDVLDGDVVPDIQAVGVVVKRFRDDEESAVFVVGGIEVGTAFENIERWYVALVAGLGCEGVLSRWGSDVSETASRT